MTPSCFALNCKNKNYFFFMQITGPNLYKIHPSKITIYIRFTYSLMVNGCGALSMANRVGWGQWTIVLARVGHTGTWLTSPYAIAEEQHCTADYTCYTIVQSPVIPHSSAVDTCRRYKVRGTSACISLTC